MPDVPFGENRIFKDGYLPCGEIRNATDSLNRVLWFIEYATISIEVFDWDCFIFLSILFSI